MHRSVLEAEMDILWQRYGMATGAITESVTRQVIQVPVPGSSITGETNFRVTATSTPSDPSQNVAGASSGPPC